MNSTAFGQRRSRDRWQSPLAALVRFAMSSVPNYLRSTASMKGKMVQREPLGKVAGNAVVEPPKSARGPVKASFVRPVSAKVPSHRVVASSRPLTARSKEASAPLDASSSSVVSGGAPKDVMHAKELILDGKGAELSGDLRTALNKYREALKHMPAGHLSKLREKINSVRAALALQNAAKSGAKPPTVAAEPVAKKPTEPVAKKPAEPVAKKPAEPVAKKPAEPVAKKPAEPVAKKPAAPKKKAASPVPSPKPAPVAVEEVAPAPEASVPKPAPSPPKPTAFESAGTSLLEASLMDLFNSATEDVLLKLPGIGPKRASAIVAARESVTFGSLSDLSHAGFSEKQAAKLFEGYATGVAQGKLALTAAKARKSM
jgi:hypothetical protein